MPENFSAGDCVKMNVFDKKRMLLLVSMMGLGGSWLLNRNVRLLAMLLNRMRQMQNVMKKNVLRRLKEKEQRALVQRILVRYRKDGPVVGKSPRREIARRLTEKKTSAFHGIYLLNLFTNNTLAFHPIHVLQTFVH